ncbi:uncharacterized protein N7503_010767 [Penicillium pulvis]|uniref:uncharacterized protein n=1 Tax=Penicillium pulvis TaxID=1562058 RepID=UPI002546D841|nr:uncharacterized protein N7503_010767 [Penicillium pulvis]KAJ5785555.1 hypothetical protein N7503_010767 [Penicillium pulvis]
MPKTRSFEPIKLYGKLEDKIDSLVSQLERSRVIKSVVNTLSTPQTYTSSPVSSYTITKIQASPGSTEPTVDPSSPEQCLAEFRVKMLKYFPFMHLPYNAEWMYTHRPFLFTCIQAASSRSTKVKLELGEKIKQTLIQRVYFDNNAHSVDLDLLLGLLTFIAWGHDNLLNGTSARVSRFSHLAMTLVFSLRLNKPPPQESNMLPLEKTSSNTDNPARTLEERRAVLGCFVVSSVVSSYFAQIDTMQWTPYMDECIEVLSEQKESMYDEAFVQQVKLQRLAEDIEDIKGRDKLPPAFFSAGLRYRLNDIKMQLSPQLLQDEIMLSSIYYTELSISGLMLCNKNFTDSQELESLYQCLNTIKSALENFFRLPASEYFGIPFPFFTQLARTIVMLIKLSTSTDAFWDSALVTGEIDVLQVLDRLLNNMDEAQTAMGDQAKDGYLDKAFKVFTSVRSWCSSRLDRKIGEVMSDPLCDGNFESNIQLEDFFLDDAWFKDYLI